MISFHTTLRIEVIRKYEKEPFSGSFYKHTHISPTLAYSALLPNAIDGTALLLSKINPVTYLLSCIQGRHFGKSLSLLHNQFSFSTAIFSLPHTFIKKGTNILNSLPFPDTTQFLYLYLQQNSLTLLRTPTVSSSSLILF